MTETAAAHSAAPDEHLARVLAAMDPGSDDRFRELLGATIRHLHALVQEVRLTPEEWMAAIRFLTAVGHKSDDERQEFILLSDVLGVSMLLELLHEQPLDGVTEQTVLGPFFVPGAPAKGLGDSIVEDPATGGEPLEVGGTVRDLAGAPVGGATIDVWQVQPNRRYDIEEDAGRRNLRGTFTTGPDGAYHFHTVRPVDYPVPHDGPVGALLEAAGRSPWRPAHIHLMVRAPAHRALVTHVFDAASPHLRDDAVFGVRDSIIVAMDGGACHFDITLAPA
jgi:hydroxyquinol 1,2-dioxygenase